MSIKTKLLILISTMLFSFLLIFGGYSLAMTIINKIEEETSILEILHNRILNEEMLFNRMLSQSIYIQNVEEFFVAVEKTNEIFEEVESIDYIRSLNPNVAKALEITTSWYELRLENLEQFRQSEIQFREIVEDIYFFMDSFNFVKIYLYKAFLDDQSSEQIILFNNIMTDFTYRHMVYEDILDRCVFSINEQFNAIELEVNIIIENTFLIAGVAVLALLILILIGSFLFANSIVSNILKIDESVKSLSEGNFSMNLDIKSKDEFGLLANDFRVFKKELRHKFESITDFMADLKGTITKERNIQEIEKKIGIMFRTDDYNQKSKEFEKKCKKYNISNREKEIIRELENGPTYKEIAKNLFVTFSTVNTHMNNIFKKCNVQKKTELIRLFYK